MFYNKKGFTTVFLVIITGAMISLVICFIQISVDKAAVSYCNSLFNLAGRSVLSEYDRELKARYGIIAFYGNYEEIREKLAEYVTYTIKDGRYIRIKDIRPVLKEYSLLNCDCFEEQILRDNLENILNFPEEKNTQVITGSRVLRNSKAVDNLPSYGITEKPSVASAISRLEGLSDISSLFQSGKKETFTYIYMFARFKSGLSGHEDGTTFFQNEIEYILYGKNSDAANAASALKDIKSIRTALNVAHIYSDPVKRNETLLLAEALTPGPPAAATQAVIIAAWAAAEAEADMKVLKEGGSIPFIKKSSDWITDIDGKITRELTSYEGRGGTYDDYLKVLLCFVTRETKLLRMMDLIQINLQGTYWGSFYIKDFYRGFTFETKVNRKRTIYNEQY